MRNSLLLLLALLPQLLLGQSLAAGTAADTRTPLALLNFAYDAEVVSQIDARFVQESIERGILTCGTYKLVDRVRLEELLAEIQRQEVLSDAQAAELGRLAGAKLVAYGTLAVVEAYPSGGAYAASVKVTLKKVDVTTSEILTSELLHVVVQRQPTENLAKAAAIARIADEVTVQMCPNTPSGASKASITPPPDVQPTTPWGSATTVQTPLASRSGPVAVLIRGIRFTRFPLPSSGYRTGGPWGQHGTVARVSSRQLPDVYARISSDNGYRYATDHYAKDVSRVPFHFDMQSPAVPLSAGPLKLELVDYNHGAPETLIGCVGLDFNRYPVPGQPLPETIRFASTDGRIAGVLEVDWRY